MNRLEVIGNLGADAEVKIENGSKFVSLSIADTRRVKKQDGTYDEKTLWISATINGDGGNLLPYLVKGAKVCAIGDMEVRMYHSEKQRALVAGVKMFVRDIQLISTNVDDVPRDLYDADGVAHHVTKYFFCDTACGKELYNRSGEMFNCNNTGWVTRGGIPFTDNAVESAASNESTDSAESTESAAATNSKKSKTK